MTDRVPEHWQCTRCHEPLKACLCPLGPLRPLRDYVFSERKLRIRNVVIAVGVLACVGALYFTLGAVERGVRRTMAAAAAPPTAPPAPTWLVRARTAEAPQERAFPGPITYHSILAPPPKQQETVR